MIQIIANRQYHKSKKFSLLYLPNPFLYPCPNVSTTHITAMGCWQCLPLSVVQLKVNIAENPSAVMGL